MSKSSLLQLILLLVAGFGVEGQSSIEPKELLCENRSEPLGIATAVPRLSWKNLSKTNGAAQTAYRLIAASGPELLDNDAGDLWDTGKVESQDSIMLSWTGAPLAPRSLVYWKVRTWDERGTPSKWSGPTRFSVGLITPEAWQANYIGLSPESGNPGFPQFRKVFHLNHVGRSALLHVNSLGYHEIFINEKKVDDSVLTPAVSQMDKRTFVITYDVTPFLRRGSNALAIWLGQGWFSGGLPGVAYTGPVVRAQLEVLNSGMWETALATGNGWKARPSEITAIGTWRGGSYGGEKVDARKSIDAFASTQLDDSGWAEAAVVEIPARPTVAQMVERNRVREVLHPAEIRSLGEKDAWLIDFGKSLTGWVEIDFTGAQLGQEITMDFSDFHAGGGKLEPQGQQDIYIAGTKGKQVFRNRFNYHGFRYVKISNLQKMPDPNSVRAFLIHTDYRIASSFESSDQDLNRIHNMIFYTLRCLSLGGYLVDCPQIERLGYGGDGNASTLSAQTMFHLGPLYSGWLDDWADCIRPDGGMPHTAPNPYPAGGGPYWCGFIITASWNTYQSYRDLEVLKRNYPVMKRWIAYVEKYSQAGLLMPWPETDYRAWYLGDWASPKGIDDKHAESINLVANSYIVVCLDTLEKIAGVLGLQTDANEFKARKDKLKALVHRTFYKENSAVYADGDQVDLAFPLIAGIVPESLRAKVTGCLQDNIVTRNKGHLATGLVGVPVVTEWATTSRSADLMYSMLKAKGYPGYLHMLDNGATTTWEHWNGERSRIHNCFNGIGSWFYQALGGLRPLEAFPAYRRFIIDPQTPRGLAWVKVEKDTPYGMIRINWEQTDGRMTINATVPVGTMAETVVPENANAITVNGKAAKAGRQLLASGSHQVQWAY